jgi:hypothetical protein
MTNLRNRLTNAKSKEFHPLKRYYLPLASLAQPTYIAKLRALCTQEP